MQQSHSMTAGEVRASVGLAAIFGLRMLGLFIILPIFALYAERLPGGHDHLLIGIALGAYGLTQAILQIPFGSLSDRWGRKRTIYLGLIIFAAGSLVAALAQDIYMVILGRVIQGAGAISAAVIALLADLTRDEQRSKAMAIVGMTIGATFALSIVAAPALNHLIGVPGIFALTGVLALIALPTVRYVVPDVAHAVAEARQPRGAKWLQLVRDRELARLNFGIFVLHAVLMALFVVVPFELRDAGLPAAQHWQVYLPVMIGSFILMVPPLILAERRGRHKSAFLFAIGALVLAEMALRLSSASLLGIAVALLLFFAGFNFLEASLPALISRVAPPAAKGAAVGVYSGFQFFGAFVGGAAGGFISQRWGAPWVFGFCCVLSLAWLVVAATMQAPQRAGTRIYTVPPMDAKRADGLSRRLAGVSGVREAMVLASEGVARLTVDSARFDEQSVLELIAGET